MWVVVYWQNTEISPILDTSTVKQPWDSRTGSSLYGTHDRNAVFTCSPSNRCGRRSLNMRNRPANSCGALSAVSRLSSTVSKLGYFSMLYLIACMVFFPLILPAAGSCARCRDRLSACQRMSGGVKLSMSGGRDGGGTVSCPRLSP